jgi:hypothetical protein
MVSNTIQVVNRYSFKSIATIDKDLKNPSYIVFANGKGYVTNWEMEVMQQTII